MSRIRINFIKVVLIILLLLLFTPYSFAQAKEGNLKADRVQYYRSEELIIATGNARLKVDKVDIMADKMEIDLRTNKLKANGKVTVIGADGEFNSKEIEYDLKTKQGIFIESDGIIVSEHSKDPIRIKSEHTERDAEKTEMKGNEFTTCDLDEPHYHISSTTITVYPGDKIIAYNAVLWEFNGNIPIMYLPIIVYSLKDDQQALQSQIGHNKVRGWFIKNTYNYKIGSGYDNFLGRLEGDFGQLYLDYYTKTGFAGGFKHYFRTDKNDSEYLYFYLDGDERNKEDSPWVTLEYDRYLDLDDLQRDYTIGYRNYYGSDNLSSPEKGTVVNIDFDQDLTLDNWENDLEIYYDRDKYYKNKLSLDIGFDNITEDRTDLDLELDLDYDLKEKETSRSDKYGLEIDLDKEFYNEELNKYDDLEFDFDYDLTDKDQGKKIEYNPIIEYKKYLTKDIELTYNWEYTNKENKISDTKSWYYDTSLELEGDYSAYDWTLTTSLDRDYKEIKEYYLPKLDIGIDPGRIWDGSYWDNLDINLGAVNKHHKSWEDKKQRYYYKLDYSDYFKISRKNRINYTETYEQNRYSDDYQSWYHRSRIYFTTDISKGWSNKLTHTYQMAAGEVPVGFTKNKDEEHKIEEKLSWRRGSSDFYIETGYNILEQEYDDLDTKLDYHFNKYSTLEMVSSYDLNKNQFEDFATKYKYEHGNLEYKTGLRAYFNQGEVDKIRYDNDLDWTFGKQDYEWKIELQSSYNSKTKEFDTANIMIEKMLHCRKITLAYDHIKGETWFEYQILAFPQAGVNFGSSKDEGMLYDEDLGGILDE
ncbi:LPS-assembly protein LptD [Orenia marismortui]|uniref:LPS-assembly protein LptD n=1 Tax=Orenia marismortui TaxID=46469 RepID=UPI00036CB49D|nr:LPS-assembly protein LptD [Orenia marismortui]